MLDLDRLRKFQKAFERLADPHSGEGTRTAALNALFNMCQTDGIDIRDFHITMDGDAQDMYANVLELDRLYNEERERWEKQNTIKLEIIVSLQAEVAALKYAKAEHKTKTLNDANKALVEARREIERLTQENATLRETERNDADDADDPHHLRIAELEAEIVRRDLSHHLRIAELEGKLAKHHPKTDPWQERIADWLAAQPDTVWRVASCEILEAAVGLNPEISSDVEACRRLSRIIRIIGGWSDATNIPHDGKRVRGYQRARFG